MLRMLSRELARLNLQNTVFFSLYIISSARMRERDQSNITEIENFVVVFIFHPNKIERAKRMNVKHRTPGTNEFAVELSYLCITKLYLFVVTI